MSSADETGARDVVKNSKLAEMGSKVDSVASIREPGSNLVSPSQSPTHSKPRYPINEQLVMLTHPEQLSMRGLPSP